MSQYLGVDYGSKRIGLAVGDTVTSLAIPVATLAVRGDLQAQVKAVGERASEYALDGLVVGLPLNMDGSEGPQAQLTRRFATLLGQTMNQPVQYHDERLSSVTADALLLPASLTRKKKKARLDGVAAQVMLQEFLDELAASS